ncbi:insulinase family protein [Alicyclobacillus cycloheptanicus]|uniref:Zn-dependent peptidase n=1 Tax=Alicyclobacillus cycloheptanicus TaxID=1457 RepID=A0ABT9XFT0_9BACL|nr:pitrilysin family protein [Alicyclobacillus cycloheptanicus]MDQ0188929.1 putative Zn-dependent peptidase [Alicyclobacillus cycloheptanicus]WDM01722.1 insulinase family protein [Alicyclobacillus cycloheptanicus]
MRELDYSRLRERLYTEQLDNGLTVFLAPKPGYQQVFATFTTHYGSIDSVFRVGDEAPAAVPDGIAHFLEHKMFESPQGDVFNEFAKNGAAANAFTTFDQTTYLFSCTENAKENMQVLLDFVQEPYFTDENVEKEKGIIGQEIRMYDDNPEWRSFFGLLRGLYQQHPVRIDIAGTVESIAKIDKETLYRCYRTFYHPSNMMLFCAGGFDPKEMMDVIRSNQAKKSFGPAPDIERIYPEEPSEAGERKSVAALSVSQPRCLIGWKDANTGLTGQDLLAQEMLTGVILDVLFGRSSPLYHRWIDEGLIDQQFTWEYELTPSYGYSLVGGNTADPDRLIAEVNDALARAAAEGLPEEAFHRGRKKAMGRFVGSLDSPNFIARSFSSYYFKGVDLFDTVEVLESLTLQQANERLRAHFIPRQQAVSIVLPKAVDAPAEKGR